jgi:hypothetical protein
MFTVGCTSPWRLLVHGRHSSSSSSSLQNFTDKRSHELIPFTVDDAYAPIDFHHVQSGKLNLAH